MRPSRHTPLLVPVVLLAALSVSGLSPPPAHADVCSNIPSIPLVPNPLKSGCELVAHPQKSAEKIAEDVTHPAKALRSAITAPFKAAGDEVMQGVTTWVAEGASWLVEQAGKLIGETTTPRIESPWFLQQYSAMAGLAALFALPFLFFCVIQAIIRRDAGLLLRATFIQLPLAFLLMAIAVTVVQLLLALTDQMSSQIAGTVGSDAKTFISTVAKALTSVAAATGSPVPLFAIFLGAFAAAAGAFAVWVELLIRADGVYVAVLFLPFTFVAMIWPATVRWCRRLVELLGAIIFSKFAIVAIMVLAAAGLSHSGSSEAFAGVLAGAGLLLLAALSPLVLLRLIPIVEAAAHTSWRPGVGAQMLGPVAGPAAVMRRVTDANWGTPAGGLHAAPVFAGAAGLASAHMASDQMRSRTEGIGGAAGRASEPTRSEQTTNASSPSRQGTTRPETTQADGAPRPLADRGATASPPPDVQPESSETQVRRPPAGGERPIQAPPTMPPHPQKDSSSKEPRDGR